MRLALVLIFTLFYISGCSSITPKEEGSESNLIKKFFVGSKEVDNKNVEPKVKYRAVLNYSDIDYDPIYTPDIPNSPKPKTKMNHNKATGIISIDNEKIYIFDKKNNVVTADEVKELRAQ